MNYKVLIIDRAEIESERLGDAFRDAGYDVRFAFGMADFVRAEAREEVDLVLLRLPDLTSAECRALEQSAEADSPVPFILIASTPSLLPERLLKNSILLSAPVEIPALLETVSHVDRGCNGVSRTNGVAANRRVTRHSIAKSRLQYSGGVEHGTLLLAGTALKSTERLPHASAKERLDALRRAWDRCNVAEQRVFMEEIAAIQCARDFFL
jgi:DNA-binding response OmpR family regulator